MSDETSVSETSANTHHEIRGRSFRRDERGVSAVLGAILMFGLLMAMLVSIQATAVPVWNQGIEYQHDVRIEEELADFQDDILRTARDGGDRSDAIELGVTYPTRPFLISPTDPTGTLATTPEGTVTVAGAVAEGEAGDYWDGSPVTYTTRSITYQANYNEYRNAPRYVIENTAYFEQYPDRDLPVSESSLVDDQRINLVLINGSVSRTGVRPAVISTREVSAPVDTTLVRADGEPIRVAIPTLADRTYWETALGDERIENGGHVTALTFQEGEPYNRVTVQLEAGPTYRLRTAAVGVGDAREREVPHYLTEGRGDATLGVNEPEEIEFVVRDRYTNPVSGVDVEAVVVDGPGELVAVDDVSDTDGTVTYRYVSGAAGEATVRATFGPSPGTLETAERTISVYGTGGGGAGGTGGSDATGTGGVTNWSATDTTETFSQEGGRWQGIDGASSLRLSDALFTPVRPSDQQLDPNKEYLRFALVFEGGDTTYVYEFSRSRDGVERQTGGSWGNTQIEIWRKEGDARYQSVGTADLSRTALEALYQGTADMNLFEASSYRSRVDAVSELRDWLGTTQDVDLYVADMDGRITITLE